MRSFVGAMLSLLLVSGLACIPEPTRTPEKVDQDGDGYTAEEGDCNEHDAEVYPGSADAYGDGADQNCDGVDGVDADGDGWASSAGGGPDCDDNDPLLGDISVDADCDGVLTADDCDDADATTVNDMDCDGVLTADDCNDDDASLRAISVDPDCDGYCDDDGLVDEYCGPWGWWCWNTDTDVDGLDCEAYVECGVKYAVCGPYNSNSSWGFSNDTYVSWDDAQSLCVQAGYDGLGSIQNTYEMELVEYLMMDASNSVQDAIDLVWIGYRNTGGFSWSDGSDSTYTNWDSGEPSGGNEECTLVDEGLGFMWNDAVCSLNTVPGFLCTSR